MGEITDSLDNFFPLNKFDAHLSENDEFVDYRFNFEIVILLFAMGIVAYLIFLVMPTGFYNIRA